jgi:hypothetical protein
MLSPLAPLGSSAVLSGTSQNNVVSTIRNNEVCPDSTVILALESALRRKQKTGMTVKLATSQRVVRAQRYDGPNLAANFQLFSLSTSGRMDANSESLLEALHEHLSYYLRLFKAINRIGIKLADFHIGISVINPNLKQRAGESVIKRIKSEFPDVEIGDDIKRDVSSGYYQDFALSFSCRPPDGDRYIRLVDGGNTDWTQKLLSNRKEFFFGS